MLVCSVAFPISSHATRLPENVKGEKLSAAAGEDGCFIDSLAVLTNERAPRSGVLIALQRVADKVGCGWRAFRHCRHRQAPFWLAQPPTLSSIATQWFINLSTSISGARASSFAFFLVFLPETLNMAILSRLRLLVVGSLIAASIATPVGRFDDGDDDDTPLPLVIWHGKFASL